MRTAILLLYTALSFVSFSQQTPTPRTLLWRISGKALQKPSYLYGTMHLQDKRLFQFGDSLYHAIEHTEGFATEVDFQEVMDSVFHNIESMAKKERLLANQKRILNRSRLHPSVMNLLKKFGVTGNTITVKQLKDIHDYRLQQLMRDGEMSTIVDAFLLGLAQRQGKWTGGIEDISDQLDLNDVLGADLKVEAVLQPEKEYRLAMDSLIGLYLDKDLDKIDAWSNRAFDGRTRDALLIRRNVKMAYRMDSLSAVRTTFFAVGAAHLPGDSGVIQLLRKRGYQVDPVYAATTIDGESYASRLDEKSWNLVKGHGDAYTVEMPGEPTDMSKTADGPKMKMFYDLTSMTLFMSTHVTGFDPKTKSLETMLQEGAKNMGGKVPAKTVAIMHRGLEGRETTTYKDDYIFRIRVLAKGRTLYMLIAGAAKKTAISEAESNRFFASFIPGEEPEKKPWSPFFFPGKAASVLMPALPVINKEMDDKTTGNTYWNLATYNVTDPVTNNYYLFQLRQIKGGFHIENDKEFLNEMYKDYAGRLDSITRFELTEYKGYPAARMDYEEKTVNGTYKALIVIRGNQVILVLGGAVKGSNTEDIDAYLESLELLPYEATAWKKTEGPGFFTQAPSAFQADVDTATAGRLYFEQHYAYNEKDAVSYVVLKELFSQTYWAVSDSLFFEEKLQANLGETDSLLERSWVQNGGLRGIDFLVRMEGHSSLKKIRMLVSKDTLYTLFARIQEKEWNKEPHASFFESFRLYNEVPPTIYQPKTNQLLQALVTTDSAAFARAHADLDAVQFQKGDLPLLHQALLQSYQDEEEFYSTHSKLVEHILPLADATTLSFAEAAYTQLQEQENVSQYRLLQLLAKMNTSESFAVLKRLLLSSLPKAGNPIVLQQPLLDSSQLTRTLFPALLQKADDSLFGTVVAVVTNQLVEDSLLAREDLKAYKQTILQGARNEWKLLQEGTYEPWELIRWARLLGWLNEFEGTALLRTLLPQKDVFLKQAVILALLRNQHTVPATEITKVAVDKSARLYFYEAMQEIGKTNLFPALYASQKSLAESELYNLFAEDYETFTLTYVGQRTTLFEGASRLFHLFKLSLPGEEDGEHNDYLCVAGPYKAGTKEKVLYSKASGVYGEEVFHPKKIDPMLKAYLKQLEAEEE